MSELLTRRDIMEKVKEILDKNGVKPSMLSASVLKAWGGAAKAKRDLAKFIKAYDTKSYATMDKYDLADMISNAATGLVCVDNHAAYKAVMELASSALHADEQATGKKVVRRVRFTSEDACYDALDCLCKFKMLNVQPSHACDIDKVSYEKDGCSILVSGTDKDAVEYVCGFAAETDLDTHLGTDEVEG